MDLTQCRSLAISTIRDMLLSGHWLLVALVDKRKVRERVRVDCRRVPFAGGGSTDGRLYLHMTVVVKHGPHVLCSRACERTGQVGFEHVTTTP